MPTNLEDAISLMDEELEQVDPVIPSLGKITAAYMFGAAEALRANPNGSQEKLTFTNLLRVNDEAGDLEPEILDNFVSEIRNKLENSLQPQASLVESFKLVEATDTKEDVCVICMSELSNGASNIREMPCLHQYHEDCICKWLECNQSYPISRYSLCSK
ncbi:hypothetical protein AMTRI_Chr04g182950 [Amborella trichopoda]